MLNVNDNPDIPTIPESLDKQELQKEFDQATKIRETAIAKKRATARVGKSILTALLFLSTAYLLAKSYSYHNLSDIPFITLVLGFAIMLNWLWTDANREWSNEFDRWGYAQVPSFPGRFVSFPTTPSLRVLIAYISSIVVIVSFTINAYSLRSTLINRYIKDCNSLGLVSYSNYAKKIEKCMQDKGIFDYNFDRDFNPNIK